jgi:tripartite-type tricarboxylate transporter receptor subunit TctC
MNESGKLRRALTLTLGAAWLAAAPAAWAAGESDQAVKLVVPYDVGGTIDIIGRLLAPKLSAALGGQPVIVENKPGAGTMIGANAVARAKPDGLTLFLGSNSAFTISPRLMAKALNYDPVRDFTAIGTLASFPNLIVVPPQSPYKTLADVLKDARANPDKVSYASFGAASTSALSGEAIKIGAGLNIVQVPYKSGAQSVQAALSGQVNFAFDTTIGSAQRIQSGQLRGLVVTSAKRLPSLPDVPSIVEAGFADAEVEAWIALFAPAATPAPVLKRLQEAFDKTRQDPDVKKQLTNMGVELSSLDGDGTMRMVRDEYTRFGKLIEQAKIRAE